MTLFERLHLSHQSLNRRCYSSLLLPVLLGRGTIPASSLTAFEPLSVLPHVTD
jgi:hypothetical protein